LKKSISKVVETLNRY